MKQNETVGKNNTGKQVSMRNNKRLRQGSSKIICFSPEEYKRYLV